MSVEEYLNSLPKVSDEPFNEIAHHTGETRFRPLLVEARLPLDELLKIGDFKFPKVLTETFREHDAFFLVGDPYIVWPVNPQTKDNPPQQMVLRKEDGKFRRRGIGIYEAVNLVLQSQAEGVLAKIPYHREDFFNRITEDDRYYDDLTLGIQNGKPFIKCPDLAIC
jgi:hypothetical protein